MHLTLPPTQDDMDLKMILLRDQLGDLVRRALQEHGLRRTRTQSGLGIAPTGNSVHGTRAGASSAGGAGSRLSRPGSAGSSSSARGR